ncbi:MAG: ABC-F family ATP-binding cassette domain-containing protein [Ignavibacteriales bacterium]|nr:ABC-F family ATP-binding cassette domain-containing protein [Ignavibacteriales bacterium]
MLSLEHITIQFGERSLFEDVTATIGPRDRIGLVGSNGSGKSTLLKAIVGIQQTDVGTINKAQYVTVGYLPQDGVTAFGCTLYQESETAFEDVLQVQRELDDAHQQLTTLDPSGSDFADTLEVLGELQHKLEDLDAYRMKSKIERILMGLGFSIHDFERMTEEFSGGWQMRIALAKLLLKEPNVLLLDEPTNHLDIETLQWLEEYLHQYNGAIMLVSHDRTFLDNLTTKTFSLSRGKFESYAGNYSFYETEREVRKELLVSQLKNQQQHIKQTQEFIDRFRYKATKARQVQSRIKQLEKIDIVEVESEEDEIHFHFPPPQQSGRVVMELNNIGKHYGALEVFNNLDYKVERGDRIAIVGVNGAGKSTLSRILAGVESYDAGERIIGYNVVPSYFAQDQAEELDLTKDVLQTVEESAGTETRAQLRTLLGSFLFHGDDVFKSVSVLSGGEKSRLALAKMLLQPANFLIMDEPTNHLDMKSKRVLQEALSKYEGTFAIVSHDRAFLDPIVNKVLEVKPGLLRTFLGNLSDYIIKKKEERQQAVQNIEKLDAPPSDETQTTWQEQQKRRKSIARDVRAAKKKVEEAEALIHQLETRKKEVEVLLANPDFYKNGAEAKLISAEYKDVQIQIEKAYAYWSDLIHQLDQVEKDV